MLEIFKLGDDILRQKCTEIKTFDSALAMLADAMIETMDEAEGVGLAGPQVGVDKKIFVIRINGGEPMVFINPEILETSIETGPYEEGCLSLPGVYHNVTRPLAVKLQYQDLKGKAHVINADGILARVIQHENDHLSGKLYIDRLDEVERDLMIRAYEKRNKIKKKKFGK